MITYILTNGMFAFGPFLTKSQAREFKKLRKLDEFFVIALVPLPIN